MKKLVLSAMAVFAFTFSNAQSREKGTVELIPQIGYSSANYYGSGVGGGNNPIGEVAFGVGADYFFNDRWSLRSGLLYQTMGSEYEGFKDELKYLTVPLNANWHFGSTRKWNLNFGPSIGFIMSAETNGEDVKEFVNSTQVGLNVGIGYKIEVSTNFSILVDYQSMTGLTDVAKDFSFKNNYGAFNVGAVLKL